LLVLGIESSCDETAVALVRDGREVVYSKVSSQIAQHAPFGGVIPEIAAREHLRVIAPMFAQMRAETGFGPRDIDLVAVTQGPGLVGALLVGVSFAKGLSLATGVPLQPVDHVHAHVHGALLGMPAIADRDLYPMLSLVVSGGHTNLYFNRSPVEFELLAHSIDDACGECFDKVGKLLGLPFPGGPQIEKRAADGGNSSVIQMPRMVGARARMEFSYSGLKTFVANLIAKESRPIPPERLADICAAFQDEALDQLARKLSAALAMRPETKRIVIAGGVAANRRFRDIVAARCSAPVHFPDLAYCSDNAAMIAALGHHEFEARGRKSSPPESWDVYSRYPFELHRGRLPSA